MDVIAAVQSQVQVVLDQLRTLSERTDSHGSTLQPAGKISDINGMVVELQRNIQLLDAKEYTDKPVTDEQFITHQKRRVDDFFGDLEKFRDWLDDSIAYISIIDAALGKVLNEVSEEPKETDMDNWELTLGKERLEEINVKVHRFLRMKFQHNANMLVKEPQ